MRRVILSMAMMVIVVCSVAAQSSGRLLSLAVRGSYTTSSKVFYNPDSPSDDLRGQYTGIDGIYGLGGEVRVYLAGRALALSLVTEYFSRINEQVQLVGYTNPPRPLPVKEGFRLVPVEVGAEVYIPLGSDIVRMSMGGGVGAYFGSRTMAIAGVGAIQQNKPVTYGIHVETSIEYQVLPGIFARADMRFRDPEFTTESRFEREATLYNGVLIPLPREPFRARINVNGVNFGLSLAADIL